MDGNTRNAMQHCWAATRTFCDEKITLPEVVLNRKVAVNRDICGKQLTTNKVSKLKGLDTSSSVNLYQAFGNRLKTEYKKHSKDEEVLEDRKSGKYIIPQDFLELIEMFKGLTIDDNKNNKRYCPSRRKSFISMKPFYGYVIHTSTLTNLEASPQSSSCFNTSERRRYYRKSVNYSMCNQDAIAYKGKQSNKSTRKVKFFMKETTKIEHKFVVEDEKSLRGSKVQGERKQGTVDTAIRESNRLHINKFGAAETGMNVQHAKTNRKRRLRDDIAYVNNEFKLRTGELTTSELHTSEMDSTPIKKRYIAPCSSLVDMPDVITQCKKTAYRVWRSAFCRSFSI